MILARWLLGGIIVLMAIGFLGLGILVGGFRRSFGASEVSPLITIVPLFFSSILLAGLIRPDHRALLHLGFLTAVLVIVYFGVQIVRESATVGYFAILYLLGWISFYAVAVTSHSPSPQAQRGLAINHRDPVSENAAVTPVRPSTPK